MVRVNLAIDEPLWLRLRAVAVARRQHLGGRASVCGVVRELVLRGLEGFEADRNRGSADAVTTRKARGDANVAV